MMRLLDLAEAVAAGDLRPRALVELAAEAIAQREGEVRAFARLDLDRARLLHPAEGALQGIPVAVKDIFDTAAFPTEYGSPIHAGHRPKADASLVVRLEAAGGLVLGKSVTSEFGYVEPPVTRNPHDATRTPGTSSGGSAAAVAAGFAALAIGTQTGSSTLRPASYCGVAAIKPSYRLLPMTGAKAFAPLLDTAGLFAARVADLGYALEALSSRAMRIDGRDFGRPVFGLLRQGHAGEPEPAGEAVLVDAIRRLERAGATVKAVTEPSIWRDAYAAHRVLIRVEGAASLAWEHRTHADRLSDRLRAALDEGAAIPMDAFDAARGVANRARKAAASAFEGVDALLTFAVPGEAPAHDDITGGQFCRLPTLLGLPAVNVPFGRGPNGLPIGLQVLGRFGDDHATLAAAAFLEALSPEAAG